MLLSNLGGSVVIFLFAVVTAFMLVLLRRFLFVEWPDNAQKARHTTPPPASKDIKWGAFGNAADYAITEWKGRLETLATTALLTFLAASLGTVTFLVALRHFFHHHMFSATTNIRQVWGAGAFLWAIVAILAYLTTSRPTTTTHGNESH
jgi:hypothetical protein